MTRWSAAAGAAAWCAIAAVFFSGRGPLGPIELMFLLAPLVVVPLGVELLRFAAPPGPAAMLLRWVSWMQPIGAILLIFSFRYEPGAGAALWISGWVVVGALVGLAGLIRLAGSGSFGLETLCFVVAQLYLLVGVAWLGASRWGYVPLGFAEPIVLLTAVHFHFAGFAASMVTGATLASVRRANQRVSIVMRAAAVGVLIGPALVAAGFVLSLRLKVFAIALFSLSLVTVTLHGLPALRNVRPLFARTLVGISTSAILVGMALAVLWALGEWTGRIWIDLEHMARFHGALNGIGFSSCGLLGWLLAKREEVRT
jgi:hypothetical protein